ncbi:MAG: HAMP domain-containing sensor histidine kinase [Pseudomonadota bacterium]
MAGSPRLRNVLLRSGAFRLAALQAVLFALIVAALFGVTWLSVGAYVEQRVHSTATDELRVLTHVLNAVPAGSTAQETVDLDEGEHFGLFDVRGRYIDGEIKVRPLRLGDTSVHILSDGPVPRLLHVVEGRLNDGRRLFVGFDRRRADALLARLRHAFLTACLGGVAAALLAGFLTAQRYLRRVDHIAKVAAQIVDGQSDTRLAVSARDDEIDRLSAALNKTWRRNALVLESMRQLSTDIAHELRTPLAHLRFRLEKSRSAIDADNPALAAMDRSIADVDQVLTVFGALLRISQIQARQRRAGFEQFDLSQLAIGVAADYRPLFEDEGRSLRTDIKPDIGLVGDRALLVQLLVNLIENVLRHTPAGVPVTLRLTSTAEVIQLSVADVGPGIPYSQHERVLQRFVRLDTSRSGPGTGLGLSLVKAISDLHEASLQLDDMTPGLRVTVLFPVRK